MRLSKEFLQRLVLDNLLAFENAHERHQRRSVILHVSRSKAQNTDPWANARYRKSVVPKLFWPGPATVHTEDHIKQK